MFARTAACFVFALCLTVASAPVRAEEGDLLLTLKNHTFTPGTLTLPAGKKVKLTIRNEDATPAEFESHDLRREKIIPPKGSVTVFIGPLEPGTYTFFDEFHPKTAQGKVVVQ